MYADYFGLDEPPFAITPDPRYLFLGRRHAEALAHLLYGIRAGGGFVLLTGEVGTGKTTLTRCLLDEMPQDVDVALILNPRLDVTEFLEAICQELKLEVPAGAGNRVLVDALNRHLLATHAAGRRTVLIVDEAQNLSTEVLEQIRLLTNLETAKTKLLQILLIGQPELRDVLARPELRQLAQRVTARYHLEPLARDELAEYISHRLKIAGARAPLFSKAALRAVWKHTAGIPRRINILCDRALLGAFAREAREVNVGIVRQAAREALPPAGANRWPALAALFLLVVGISGLAFWQPWQTEVQAAGQEASVMTLESWLLTNASQAGTDNALAALFAAWGLDFEPGEKPACEQAEEAGLRCRLGRGSWPELRALDRPAVLDLLHPEGRFQLTLLARNADAVTLAAGAERAEFPVTELLRWWSGDYLALWRLPVATEPPLRPGTRHPAVAELREQLDRVLGGATGFEEAELYDEALAMRVREFQRRENLNVDGIAGEQTLLRLATLLRPAEEIFLSTRQPHVADP